MSGVTCQVSGLGVRCHLSSVRCQVLSLWCQVSPVNYHLSEKAKARATDPPSSQVSCVTCHVSGIMHHVSGVTCHVSHVMCQVSHVTEQVSHVIYSFFLVHEHPKFCLICHASADYSTWLLFFRILATLAVFMSSMIFQLIPLVLLPPTNYCFHDQVINPLPGVPLK